MDCDESKHERSMVDAGQLRAVNSASVEGRPSLSFDGTSLYFMSNRLGGFGNLDVYVTTRSKLRGSD